LRGFTLFHINGSVFCMAEEESGGKLSIVATPIGNMGDITFRALWTLKEADMIYAEDTRVTSKLFVQYGLQKPLKRLDAVTEEKKAKEIIDLLAQGKSVALVTDAGTPGISDPGARLVAAVRAKMPEATIEAIPGPSAITAALSISGIDTTAFTFVGFLPHKKGRQTALREIAASKIPVVIYESPHRILKLLAELAAHNVRRVVIGRELTKMHEEILIGEPLDLAKQLTKNKAVRGEFVVITNPSVSKKKAVY
jgi:16S rRNA (cytidine1402-2'-O)-methyltransferase